MEIYFFDANGLYIGHRALLQGEAIPDYATTVSVTVGDGQEAYWTNGAWAVKAIVVL